jgi:transcriptional regulator with XRE-family HTH domain
MAADQGPVVQSALLRSELIRLRKESGLTREQVADALDWSPSKLIRVEGGHSSITKVDLDALLANYGVSSEGQRERFHSLNRGAPEHTWWRAVHGEETLGIAPTRPEDDETGAAFPGQDELTCAAEVTFWLFPPDPMPASASSTPGAADTEQQPSRLESLIRRIGLRASLIVPGSNAGEMLSLLRQVSTVLSWVALVLGTLAIMAPAGMTARSIIIVITIEFLGFVTGTLALSKRRKDGK